MCDKAKLIKVLDDSLDIVKRGFYLGDILNFNILDNIFCI